MSKLFNEVNKETNVAFTQNGALSLKTSLSDVLDFFAISGSLRGNGETFVKAFQKAFAENRELAVRALFFARDVRGGQGERENFRKVVLELAVYYPEVFEKIYKFIPDYGRWDDLWIVSGLPVFKKVVEFVKNQINEDISNMEQGKSVSLLAKWLPSNNTSSKESVDLANTISEMVGISPKKYRKTLSILRAHIKIVESKMSARLWDSIEYDKVPSKASSLYSKAFAKHDSYRYSAFIDSVNKGEAKINSATLYPYEVVLKCLTSSPDERNVCDALWKNLPDYQETPENALVVADVSGSMTTSYGRNAKVRPIDVSVSLAIYFAERNKGIFKNQFITFSDKPDFYTIKGKTLFEKITSVEKSTGWCGSTDLQKVFKVILETAKRNNISEEEMPKKLYIISDMQFNSACVNNDSTNFQEIERKYEEAGYKRPSIVFWNVNGSLDKNSPVDKDETGSYLVSGLGPSILKYAVNCESVNPEGLMLEVLNSERYAKIIL